MIPNLRLRSWQVVLFHLAAGSSAPGPSAPGLPGSVALLSVRRLVLPQRSSQHHKHQVESCSDSPAVRHLLWLPLIYCALPLDFKDCPKLLFLLLVSRILGASVCPEPCQALLALAIITLKSFQCTWQASPWSLLVEALLPPLAAASRRPTTHSVLVQRQSPREPMLPP